MANRNDARSHSSKDASKKNRPHLAEKKAKKEHPTDSKESRSKDVDAERHPEEQIVNPNGPWNKDLKRRNDHTERI